MIDAARTLLERMIFEVASFRGLTDEQVVRRSASWLLSQYDMVLRARYAEVIGIASSTELGVTRALVPLLGGSKKKSKKMPKYPTFEETMKTARDRSPAGRAPSEFQRRFEAANTMRVDSGDKEDD